MKSPEQICEEFWKHPVLDGNIPLKTQFEECIRLAVQEAVEEACKCGHNVQDARDAVLVEDMRNEIRDHFQKAGY